MLVWLFVLLFGVRCFAIYGCLMSWIFLRVVGLLVNFRCCLFWCFTYCFVVNACCLLLWVVFVYYLLCWFVVLLLFSGWGVILLLNSWFTCKAILCCCGYCIANLCDFNWLLFVCIVWFTTCNCWIWLFGLCLGVCSF